MVVVTSIYCAKLEPVHDAVTGKIVERSLADLKEADRTVMSVYQGMRQVPPIDDER